MHRTRVVVPLLIALVVVLPGCVSDNRPADCEADEKAIRLTVDTASMEPNDPTACRGQLITLVIDPEVDGVLHIHGLDAVVPATTIVAGEEVTLEFTATPSGQFPVELHASGDSQGEILGIFTVHEH
jgi:hypothetical protein